MALNIRVEDGLPITADQACSILQHETDSFGLFIDLDRCIEYELYFKLEREKAMAEYRRYNPSIGQTLILPSQRQKLREWFEAAFDIPERLFYNQAGKVAFDKNVKAALMEANIHEEAKNFLKILNTWNYYDYRVNYLKQYFRLPVSYGVSTKQHRMLIANPKWVVLSTGRIAAQVPSLQNIARDMSDIICCPEGWKMIRCDSGQIEPRITYSHYIKDPLIPDLIRLYNDAYYGMLHYCQLPEEVFLNRFNYRVAKTGETGNDPYTIYAKEITDEMVAGRKELKVLALAANYGSALAGRDPILSKRYVDRIVNNPTRKEWEAEVTAGVNRGVETFHSVFGSVITPDETERYTKGTPSWRSHVIRCGINNPIQATASDLMICSVHRAQEILSKSQQSHIAFYKHDEGAFYIHESELDLIEELSDVTAYNVTENGQPWIPIHSELEEGQLVNTTVPTVLD